MRRLIAAVAIATLFIGTVAPAAHAGGPNDAARALASFAAFHHVMFSAFVAPLLFPPPPVVVVRPEVVYRPVVAPPPAVVYAPPAPRAYPVVAQYPHGRYERVYRGHRYVWVPVVPPPPPPFAR